MSEPKSCFSVIIPCYNTKYEFLKTLAESISPQLEKGDRVIWVDDGSSDSAGFDKLENQLSDSSHHCFFRNRENLGVAATMNNGILHAEEECYIITMGADDIFAPDYLANARFILDNNKDMDVVVPWIELIGERSGRIYPLLSRKLHIFKFFKKNRAFAASAFRKSLWSKIGGFDENLRHSYEDWDFWFRAALAGASFAEIKAIGYYYRVRLGGLYQSIDSCEAKRILRKKWLTLLCKSILLNPFKFLINVKVSIREFDPQ